MSHYSATLYMPVHLLTPDLLDLCSHSFATYRMHLLADVV